MTRLVKIYRYDPEISIEGAFKPYEVETTPGMSVMDVLDYIHSHMDPSLSYYRHSACLHGICGRCSVKVNGKTALACETPLPENGDLSIGPTSTARVLKDLITKKRKTPERRQWVRKPKAPLVTDADHFMVFAKNREAVVSAYRDTLGFTLKYGGRNEAFGYENHIIGFGLVYLEILSLLDWESELAKDLMAGELADLLEKRSALCLSWALRTETIGELTDQLHRCGFEAIGPLPMERERPDGKIPRWRLCLPAGTPFRRAHAPFFVEWITDDLERLSWEEPVSHPNGAVAVSGFSIAVKDLTSARKFYEETLGCALPREFEIRASGARCARYRIGPVSIDLISPSGDGPVNRFIETVGDGPFEIGFEVEDINKTAEFLGRQKVKVEQVVPDETGILVDDLQSFGIRIVFKEKNNE